MRPDARQDPASQYALGWVQRVWRDGEKLLGDLDVSERVAKHIADGALRFVSVELLKNVKADTRLIPWTLDAVALLGTDQPAVGTLQPLSLHARQALTFESRATFSRGGGDDADRLRRENAELTKQLIAAKLDSALEAGRILPRDKLAFGRRYGDAGTLADAVAFIKETPQPPAHLRPGPQSLATGAPETVEGNTADEQLVRLTYALMEEREEKNKPISFDDARRIVMSRNRELTRIYSNLEDKR